MVQRFENLEIDLLKQVADKIRKISPRTVCLLINRANGRLNFVCGVTDDLIKEMGLKAGDLVREVAKVTGGGGGGRPHLATAGGKDTGKLPEAIEKLRELIRQSQK